MAPRTNDRRLVRHLHGELSAEESRELEAELGRDPALAARLVELERLWRGLEPPAVEPGPRGEGARLAREALERARRRREGTVGSLLGDGLTPAPAWGRPLVAGALAAGLALGLWLGQPAARGTGTEAAAPGRVAETPRAVPAAAPVEPAAPPERPVVAEVPPSANRLPPSPRETPAAPPEPEDALAPPEAAFAGEPTLAEAYLLAMEAGADYDWEGSGP